MMNAEQIQEHMPVVGSDGQHVGTVDNIEGQRIKLTKSDPMSGGMHHYINLDTVQSVDTAVHLNMPASQVQQEWAS
ncbi:MAG: DUF2171 domain-containing protein [Hyphomicrobiales bacterium]|nr:DUF2171 domain-containing protein [Hyphomicrobiales bacterium]